MSQGGTIVLSSRRPTYGVCVVGNDTALDIYRSVPSGADSFDVRGTSSIDVTIVYSPDEVEVPQSGGKWPLNKGVKVVVSCTRPSTEMNDSKVKVSYYGQKGTSLLGSSLVYLTCVDVSLNADVHRMGAVTLGERDKGSWTWGPSGKGAILLVNCDRDKDDSGYTDSEDAGLPNPADIKDMSQMVLMAEGPEEFFDQHHISLHIETSDSDKLRVFCKEKSTYSHVLGGGKLFHKVERGHRDEILFYVEGLQFPDANFSGLVYVNLTLQETLSGIDVFTEKLAFRMAPWIMTPNTLKPLQVYVCSVSDNQDFVKQIKALTKKARCDLNVITELKNRGDRWIQDEVEFGYTEAPHKRFPVVFDSPRDRGLKDVAFKDILGPDFGYVTKEPDYSNSINSLDSFGNLEVSPPVTVNGKEYPLGRILIGSGLPDSNIKMNKVVRDFLAAQRVQAPVELYSDWLTVGHIDEFMSFVPAPDQKGFRLLLASPRACLELFREKQREGHGDAAMFDGLQTKNHVEYLTINDILANKHVKTTAESTQKSIDLNRKILKKELGLTESDIIDIPMLYVEDSGTADSFFPNMVNMLVLGKYLGIPKPFGPVIDGSCCLEERVQYLLEPLGLKCIFIDDYDSYHVNLGEVHCGTNVLRKQFPVKWWECTL